MVKFRLANYYHGNARFGYQVILKIIKKTKKNKRQIFFPRRNAVEIQRALIMAFNHKKSVGRSVGSLSIATTFSVDWRVT